MFIFKNFVRRLIASSRRYARIPARQARTHIFAHICAIDEATPNKICWCSANVGTILKSMPTKYILILKPNT